MASSFVLSQKQQLKKILQQHAKTSLYTHLDCHFILNEDFEALYNEFKEQIPIYTYSSFIDFLKKITEGYGKSDVELLNTPKLIGAKSPIGFSQNEQGIFPISPNMLKALFKVEQDMLSGKAPVGSGVKGKVFHIFDKIDIRSEHGVDVEDIRSLKMRHAPWRLKRRYLPNIQKFDDVGKSRYQRLHAFIESMEENGKDIHAIQARAQTMTDIAFLLAQREGRFVALKELCPNVELFIHYDEPITPYRKELSYFFRGLNNLKTHEVYFSSAGLLAAQDDLNIKRWLALKDEIGTFYEFIPEEDIEADGRFKRNYKRLHAGQVEKGKLYLLVLTTEAGMLGYNTGDVVEIASLNPFRVIYRRNVEKLNHFGEALPLDVVENTIAKMNEKFVSDGLFIREYMMGDDAAHQTPRWVFEISRPVGEISEEVLQRLANEIHTEIGLSHPMYHTAMKEREVLPRISFVSMGTFSTMHDHINFSHFDFSHEAENVRKVIQMAWTCQTYTPKSV